MSFEQSLKRIEEIVSLLESGEPELEKSIELYREGLNLAVSCKKDLDSAKERTSAEVSNEQL